MFSWTKDSPHDEFQKVQRAGPLNAANWTCQSPEVFADAQRLKDHMARRTCSSSNTIQAQRYYLQLNDSKPNEAETTYEDSPVSR